METKIKSTFSDGFNNLLNHFDIKINITNESQSVSDVIEFDGHSGTYGEIKSAIETQFKSDEHKALLPLTELRNNRKADRDFVAEHNKSKDTKIKAQCTKAMINYMST